MLEINIPYRLLVIPFSRAVLFKDKSQLLLTEVSKIGMSHFNFPSKRFKGRMECAKSIQNLEYIKNMNTEVSNYKQKGKINPKSSSYHLIDFSRK